MPSPRNGAIARVNVHSAVQALANGAGGLFLLVYLLRAGLPAPAVLLAEAAIVAGRFVIRPAILPFAIRFGLKPPLVVGVLAMAIPYLLLAAVDGFGPALIALCIARSVGEVFYWLAYNAYFSALGDADQRGRQVGVREAMVALAGVVAPILGTAGLVTLGPSWTFALVGLVQAAGALPLVGAPNVAVAPEAPGGLKAAAPILPLMAADGWFDAGFFFVWQIGLFLALGQSIAAYGGAMALAGVAGAAGASLIGGHLDAGYGRRAVVLVYGLAAAIVLARGFSFGLPWLAVASNAAGALLMPLLSPTIGKTSYNLAKAAPCPLRFQMANEAAWDVGCFSACLLSAALLSWGAAFGPVIWLGLPAAGVCGAVLWRRYGPARKTGSERMPPGAG